MIGTIGLLGPISQLHALDESVASVVLLVGLAVGVDYSMFYLRREMEERDAGRGAEAALEAAAATSGRAVLISGLTVMAAMAGMFLAGNAVFVSFGIGTILVVAVAVLGSLTVLPAMLSLLGQQGLDGEGPRAVGRQAAPQDHAASRGSGARSSTACSSARCVSARRSPAACSLALADPGVLDAHRQPGRRRACRATSRSCRPTTRSRRRSPAATSRPSRSIKADDVTTPEVQAAIADLQRAGDRHAAS